jgi:hypothetical protein
MAMAMAVAPVPQPRAMAMVVTPEPRPHTTSIALAFPSVQFAGEIPPAIQIAINARELSRLSLAETPADFESRFSVSGYRVRK